MLHLIVIKLLLITFFMSFVYFLIAVLPFAIKLRLFLTFLFSLKLFHKDSQLLSNTTMKKKQVFILDYRDAPRVVFFPPAITKWLQSFEKFHVAILNLSSIDYLISDDVISHTPPPKMIFFHWNFCVLYLPCKLFNYFLAGQDLDVSHCSSLC